MAYREQSLQSSEVLFLRGRRVKCELERGCCNVGVSCAWKMSLGSRNLEKIVLEAKSRKAAAALKLRFVAPCMTPAKILSPI